MSVNLGTQAVCQFREYGSGTLLKAELPLEIRLVCQILKYREFGPETDLRAPAGVESREFDPSFPDTMGPGTRAWELWVPYSLLTSLFGKKGLMTENLLLAPGP